MTTCITRKNIKTDKNWLNFFSKHLQVTGRDVGQTGKNYPMGSNKVHNNKLVSAALVIWPIKDSPYWIPPAKSRRWSSLRA